MGDHKERSGSLFSALSPDDQRHLLACASKRQLVAGERLIVHGQTNIDTMFIIDGGELAITRNNTLGENCVVIARLGAGQVVGEMSVLRAGAATANVDALVDTTVLVIERDAASKVPGLWDRLRSAVAIVVIDRLDAANADIQIRHERELQALDMQLSATRYISANMVVLSCYILALPAATYFASLRSVDYVSLLFIVSFAAVAFNFLRQEGERIKEYGFTFNNPVGQLRAGLLTALPAMALYLIAKAVVVLWFGAPLHLFDLGRKFWDGQVSIPVMLGLSAVYIVVSFAQELVRGPVQRAQEIYYAAGGKPAPLKAIFVGSLMFAATHAHLGLGFSAIAFVAGLYWGWVYNYTRSYLAVATNHGLLGAFCIFIVGVPV